MTLEMLQIDTVSKSYDGRRRAVDALSLCVGAGEIVGLLGPNGAGKTTTAMMIAGLLRPDAGRILIGGENLADAPLKAKRLLGIVPEQADMIEHLTGWEYVYLTATLYGFSGKATFERMAALFDLFAMTPFQHQLVGTYSRGMLRKVQLIAALVHQPRLLLLDEPTANLDAESILIFKRLLRQLKSHGVAILLVTHQIALAEEMCDRVYLLRQGQCIASGPPRQLLEEHHASTLEEVFVKLAVNHEVLERMIDAVVAHL